MTLGCFSSPSGSPGGSDDKESAFNAEDPGLMAGQEDLLEERMATHSNILAWRIPRTEEPDGLQSRGHKELNKTEGVHTQTQTCLLLTLFLHKRKDFFFSLTKMVALLRCNE